MAELVYRPEVADALLGLLLSQYRGKAKIEALVRSFGAGAQVLEDALIEVAVDGSLSAASSAALDRWAALVGQDRAGLDDATLRRFIEARSLVNRTRRGVDDVVRAWRLAVDGVVSHYDLYPASYTLQTVRESWMPDVRRRAAARLMAAAKPMGFGLRLVEATVGYFGFEGDDGALGFGDGGLAGGV